MNRIRKVFSSPSELAAGFASELAERINAAAIAEKQFNLVLSGGTTPNLLFSFLAEYFADSIEWRHVHLFWGDERCVSPDHPESNYGTARKKLIDKINIPELNIHRIKGEDDPQHEALRYSKEISEFTSSKNGFPLFDLIILGMGDDGHVASIFPENIDLFDSDKICEVALHPLTLQKRITITGRVINNADSVVILITGKSKSRLVSGIFDSLDGINDLPVCRVVPGNEVVRWFMDEDAASLLK